jgi:hypothetical protein
MIDDHAPLVHEEDLPDGTRVLFHDKKSPLGKSGTKESFPARVVDVMGMASGDNDFAVAAGERARERYEEGKVDARRELLRIVSKRKEPLWKIIPMSEDEGYLFYAFYDRVDEHMRAQVWHLIGDRINILVDEIVR